MLLIGRQLEGGPQELQRCNYSFISYILRKFPYSSILKISKLIDYVISTSSQLTLLLIQWGFVGLALGTVAHFWSPIFRGLTPQFKVYVCHLDFFKLIVPILLVRSANFQQLPTNIHDDTGRHHRS